MTKTSTYVSKSIITAFVAFMISTPSMAAGTPERRPACAQDAFEYCSSDIPDIDRIAACMVKNHKKLSLCRAPSSASSGESEPTVWGWHYVPPARRQ